MNLADYVKKRNGVSLGTSSSLKNMMYRSLGAARFSIFWKYWNPIWGYFLGKYINKPLKKILPTWLSIILTFAFSGFLHDLIIIAIKNEFKLIFTPWFFLMGSWVVISDASKIEYSKTPWIFRALINCVIIAACFFLSSYFRI